MSLPFVQVDAFASRAFSGNPAAVMVLPSPRDDGWMQHVAQEMNLSETAFLSRRPDGSYDLRWFSPTIEIALCGHATLASAHVLWESGELALGTMAEFHTRSGRLTAVRDGEWIELDFPATLEQPADPPPGLAEALGVTPRYIGRSKFDYLVEVDGEAAVRDATPDFGRLALLPVRGVVDHEHGLDAGRRFRLALLCARVRHQRGSGHRLGALLPDAVLEPAVAQDEPHCPTAVEPGRRAPAPNRRRARAVGRSGRDHVTWRGSRVASFRAAARAGIFAKGTHMLLFRRIFSIGRVTTAAMIGAAVVGSLEWRVRAQAGPVAWNGGLSAFEVGAYEQAAREHLDYLPNQVLVKFKDGVTREGQQRALMALRSRPDVNDIVWAGDLGLVADLGQPNANILAEQLREQPEVLYAQPNYLRHVTSAPNDPSYASKQWDLATLDMPRAWDINGGADGIVVAVVDTGITNFSGSIVAPTWNGSAIVNIQVPFVVNPDLPLSRLVVPRDFVAGQGAVTYDMEGHGSHVSGTVGEETNNGVMLAGMAYKTKIMPVKVCLSYWDVQFSRSAQGMTGYAPLNSGGCPDSGLVSGIRYAADNGAKVINVSIGGAGASTAEKDALTYAVGKGAFIAISAGNDFDSGNETQYPAKYAETLDGAMAVASVGRALRHAYYSNSGSYVEIAAPGGDEVADGFAGDIWQSTIRFADSDPDAIIFPRFDRFEETPSQGTSMASPHVAGLAALLMSQLGSSATPALVEQIIKKSARPCGASDCTATNLPAGRNDFFGAGLIQPRTALFGSGLRK